MFFFFQAEDGIRDAQESRGLGDVYKRQIPNRPIIKDLFAIADASDDDNLKTKIFAYLEDLMNASEEIDFIEKQNIQKLIWELISSQEKAKVDGSLYPEKKKQVPGRRSNQLSQEKENL
eukprot:TRINITY_DN1737_c0_g1_i5.p1 TRINITY_DN1737_c0_g1~~TRINITY_DN1737_c0_g1_i5.p1  ORF type:complete len:119 (-),score=48.09 TRINITY_DN1737_c0_g1_i5:75-431(-)